MVTTDAIRMTAFQHVGRREELAALQNWLKAQPYSPAVGLLSFYMDGRLKTLMSDQAELRRQLAEWERARLADVVAQHLDGKASP